MGEIVEKIKEAITQRVKYISNDIDNMRHDHAKALGIKSGERNAYLQILDILDYYKEYYEVNDDKS